MRDATRSGSVEAARDWRAGAASGLAPWLCLLTLPTALGEWVGRVAATSLTLGALGAGLALSRDRRTSSSPLRALAVLGLAAGAGWWVAPAVAVPVSGLGEWIGLAKPDLASPGHAALSLWLCAGILAPLVEESLYRERWLGLLRRAGPAVAIPVSSALFALPHAEAWSRLAALLVGLGLGALRWWVLSLAACVGLHAGLNLAALACFTAEHCRAPLPLAAVVAAALLLVGVSRRASSRSRRRTRSPRTLATSALAAAAIACVAGAGTAEAEALVFEGELRIEPVAPAVPILSVHGVGVATVNDASGGIALQTLALDGGIAGSSWLPVTDPLVSNGGMVSVGISAVAGAGTLRPFQPTFSFATAALSRGTLPFTGALSLCMILLDCKTPFGIALHASSASGSAGLGVGGVVTAYPHATVMLSLVGAPWTVGSTTLPLPTPGGGSFAAVAAGFAHGPYSFTGSTALPGGEVQLVSPVRITASTGGIAPPSGFGRLSVRFVPEPRSLWLLGPGLGGLALAVRRRARRGAHPCTASSPPALAAPSPSDSAA